MILSELYAFIQSKRLAVISTTHATGDPKAALVGYAFSPAIGVVFDTSVAPRKAANLLARPFAALVIGWEDETTLQLEGATHQPVATERDRAKSPYFAIWPDGRARESRPDMTYFVFRPHWIRYSNFAHPPEIIEFDRRVLSSHSDPGY